MTAAGNPATDIVYEYQAKQTEDGPVIHSYALELVSHICNNYHDVSSIDKPLPKYDNKNRNNTSHRSFCQREESEQERLIRLELRHRFYCAKAVHMPVVVFAKKLVEGIWGGELIEEAKPLTTEQGQPEEDEDEEEVEVDLPVIAAEISRSSSSDNSQTSEDEASVDTNSSGTTPVEEGAEQQQPLLPSFDDNINTMDVASAALPFLDDDDDHFLFSTDQLEEELNAANGEMMMMGNHGSADVAAGSTNTHHHHHLHGDDHTIHTTAADSIPSLHTAHTMSTASTTSTSRSERAKRRRKPSPKAREIQQDQQEQQLQQLQEVGQPASVAAAATAAAPPALESEPATTAATTKATTKKKSSTAKKARKKKTAAKNKKVEPLAKQAIPGHGRGARQKMFTWADRMVQLAEYKEKFGHIAIPTVRRDPYYNLGLWLAAQRSLYRKNALRKERLADLRNLGCLGFGGPGG